MVNDIRRGDVYWCDFGARSGSPPANRHPCVVVQADRINQSAIRTTIVCLITSNLIRAKAYGNVALHRGEANLAKESVVNVSQIHTVDKEELVERIGRLSLARVREVRLGLDVLLERS